MPKTPNLVWLRSFECAARHMSFTAAAEELGITQTAVSLHVRSLEAQLGCKLFTRAARNLSLSEVGQAYAFSIRRALGEIDLSTTSLFGTSHLQKLTVRVPISTATLFLAHRLPDFVQNHPEVSVSLVSNIWAESTNRENVDVELRLGLGDWEDMPARRISKERIVPIGAKSGGRIPSMAQLADQPLIHILGFQDMGQKYLSAFDVQQSETATSYSVDTTIAAVDIVAGGGGYAVILERFAKTAIETGREIAIVGDAVPFEQSHFLLRGNRPEPNAATIQIFEGWLERIFA
ncbi:LysR family transcriptional regulator [Ruegeria sp.]|uniref:LysR family transcriptional regulator n=1 Tax=Ruegeria sp. TaxID=1879320 RepID=UPI002314524B|nr:LysR family transcriptional regulator [Ruegeria sp.]MDA7964904.1 LysR family transcriptional regulator [Ruegeria sp.]